MTDQKPKTSQPQTQSSESKSGPEQRRQQSAGSLDEALEMQRKNEEKLAADAEKNTATGYAAAAQAELDAQQEDIDAGYSTDATEQVPVSERPDKAADMEAQRQQERKEAKAR